MAQGHEVESHRGGVGVGAGEAVHAFRREGAEVAEAREAGEFVFHVEQRDAKPRYLGFLALPRFGHLRPRIMWPRPFGHMGSRICPLGQMT